MQDSPSSQMINLTQNKTTVIKLCPVLSAVFDLFWNLSLDIQITRY
jgi:hypothetical protein